jgi:hypothetical protein
MSCAHDAMRAAAPRAAGISLALHAAALAEAQLPRAGAGCNAATLTLARALLQQTVDAVDAASARALPDASPAPAPAQVLAVEPEEARRRVHALRSTVTLVTGIIAICIASRSSRGPLPDHDILAAMPEPPWEVWVRTPTAMCSAGTPSWTLFMRFLVYPSAAALAFLPGATARRMRVAYATAMTATLLLYYIVLDPMFCAAATHARYATGGQRLRTPWQAGMRQLVYTFLAHLATENALPLRHYIPIMAARAAVPLAARAAESVGGATAAAVAHSRLLTKHFAWDAAHAGLVLLCVAHAARAEAVRAQRRLDVVAKKKIA